MRHEQLKNVLRVMVLVVYDFLGHVGYGNKMQCLLLHSDTFHGKLNVQGLCWPHKMDAHTRT